MEKIKFFNEELERTIYEEIPHVLLLEFLETYSETIKESAKKFPDNDEIQKTANIVEEHLKIVAEKWDNLVRKNIKKLVKKQTQPVKEYADWLDKA